MWQSALDALVAEGSDFGRAIVVAEVASTQDEARRLALPEGSLLVALRQTRGRGRMGRVWHDTSGHGIAMTAVLPADEPPRLSIGCAVAAARAIESLIRRFGPGGSEGTVLRGPFGRQPGIKWPNDLMLRGRKIGGILIEVCDGRAFAGIGINVSQTEWPAHLADRAASLLQCGHVVDRLSLVLALVRSLEAVWSETDDALAAEFRVRDVLSGRQAILHHNGRFHCGTIIGIEPLRALTIAPEGRSPIELPAETTQILHAAGL